MKEICCLTVVEASSPRLRKCQGYFLVRAPFLAFKEHLQTVSSDNLSCMHMERETEKERYSFFASSYKLLLFSHSVMSNSLQPRGLQHTMLPCRSPSPRTSSNSKSVMPSNHLVLRRPLLLLPSIFPNIRIFSNVSALPIRWPKYWSFSFSIGPSNEYSEQISLGLTGLISFQSKGLSRVFSNTTAQSINSSVFSLLYGPTPTSKHDYWKYHSFDFMDLCWQSNVSAF